VIVTDWARLLAPGDGARVMGMLYSVSLLSLVPLVAAVIAAIALRHRAAGERALIWRSVVIVLLVAIVGELLPFQLKAWIVPQGLASPFIVIGRAQLAVLERVAPVAGDRTLVEGILAIWACGAIAVMVPTVGGLLRLRRTARGAARVDDPGLRALLVEAQRASGVGREVRLLVSPHASVPMTWGALRPVVLLPMAALTWRRDHQRAVLLHELNHVRSADALFALAARVVCTLQWFNPLAWWTARRLLAESELACDDRVLAAGVRRSDYARMLSQAGWTPRSH
jgi:beta-lactamase regulating signal transducer with metallopeptidase domain